MSKQRRLPPPRAYSPEAVEARRLDHLEMMACRIRAGARALALTTMKGLFDAGAHDLMIAGQYEAERRLADYYADNAGALALTILNALHEGADIIAAVTTAISEQRQPTHTP